MCFFFIKKAINRSVVAKHRYKGVEGKITCDGQQK